jgi:hypothetical protein
MMGQRNIGAWVNSGAASTGRLTSNAKTACLIGAIEGRGNAAETDIMNLKEVIGIFYQY